ncbi:MAG TPA: methyltransferase [Paracoccaceae bacterium]|nr:methyltransferase [Paracoccaceae bacterium]HMO71229.1 methyltransferase [Paracoccaceae bacterium]
MTAPEGHGLGPLTDDAVLGGRVRLWQPARGFRAGTDAVLLAAACGAAPGQSVLDLGCGVGTASLCLAARVPGLSLAGVEMQAGYAALARANAARNAAALEVVEADAADLPPALRRPFDHVICNPPYYAAGAGSAARDPGREAALRESHPLRLWLDAAARRLRPGGWCSLILAADRLAEVLAGVVADRRLGSAAVLPLAARQGRAAERVILRARKGGRAPFRLLAPLILHEGARHPGDREHFTAEARDILRDAAPISRFDPIPRIGPDGLA